MRIKRLKLNKKKILLIFLSIFLIWMAGYFAFFNYSILSKRDGSLQFFDYQGESLGIFLHDLEKYSNRCDLAQVSPHFIRALILVEDKGFYSHWGINIRSLFRALFLNIQEGKVVSGGSTITMQLAKLLKNPNKKRTLLKKISEIFYALKLEFHLPKSRILEEYINRLPFGNMIYGISRASELYFDKSPFQLSLSQSIDLALIPKAPTNYNPIRNSKNLKKRRDIILKEFSKRNYVSPGELTRVLNENVVFNIKELPVIAPHFIELIKKRFKREIAGESRIYTCLDKGIQLKVKGMVLQYLNRLRYYNVQSAAVVIINNESHEIITYLGSPSYFNEKINGYVDYAISLRQPGSTLKPFVYGVALEGGYTPSFVVPDIKFPSKGGFFPQNHDGREHGPLRLRMALACSYNIPAFYLAMKLTPAIILKKLQEAGFVYLDKSSGFYGETIALGSGEVKLLDLVTAYSALATGGIIFQPAFLKEFPSKTGKRLFSEKVSFLLFDILSDPAARAGSFGYYSSMNLPFPLAIKTGTSKGFRDKWAVGVNSEYTVGVWMGNPDGKNIKEQIVETGNCATLIRDIFLTIQKDWKKGAISKPEGIVRREVCALSGALAGKYCLDTVEEYFDVDYLPVGECLYHQLRNGQVKTIYPELYQDWVQKNNLSERENLAISQNIMISSPQNGDFYYISAAIPLESQQIRFKVMGVKKGEVITYILNDKVYTTTPYPKFPWFGLKKGQYILEIKIKGKTQDKITFSVY